MPPKQPRTPKGNAGDADPALEELQDSHNKLQASVKGIEETLSEISASLKDMQEAQNSAIAATDKRISEMESKATNEQPRPDGTGGGNNGGGNNGGEDDEQARQIESLRERLDGVEAAGKKAAGAAATSHTIKQIMHPSKQWTGNAVFDFDLSVTANKSVFEDHFPQFKSLFDHQHWHSYIRDSSKLMEATFKWLERYTKSNKDYETAGNVGGAKGSVQVWRKRAFCLGKTAHDAFMGHLDEFSSHPGYEIIEERDITNMDQLLQPYFDKATFAAYLKTVVNYLWKFLDRPGSTYHLELQKLKKHDARTRGELYHATWELIQSSLEKTGSQKLEDFCEHRTKLRSIFNPAKMDYSHWFIAITQTNNRIEELQPGHGYKPVKMLEILLTALARGLPSSYQSIKENEEMVVALARMAEKIRGVRHMHHGEPAEIENLDAFTSWIATISKNCNYDPLTAPAPPGDIFMPGYGLEGEIKDGDSANFVVPRGDAKAYAAWKNKQADQYRSTQSIGRLESVLPFQPGDKRGQYAAPAQQQEKWDDDKSARRRPRADANPTATPADNKRQLLRAMMDGRAMSLKCRDAKTLEECRKYGLLTNEILHKCLQLGSGKYKSYLTIAAELADLLVDTYGTEQADAHFNEMDLYMERASQAAEALDEKPEGPEIAALADAISGLNADDAHALEAHVALQRARKSIQVLTHEQRQALLSEPDFRS